MKNSLDLPSLKLIEEAYALQKITAPLEGVRPVIGIDEKLLESINRGMSVNSGLAETITKALSGFTLPKDLETFAGLSKAWAEKWQAPLAPIMEMLEGNRATISALFSNVIGDPALEREFRNASESALGLSKALGDMPILAASLQSSARLDEILSPLSNQEYPFLETLRKHAEAIATDPAAGPEKVVQFVEAADAVDTVVPEEVRANLHKYLWLLALWLLDKVAEDPAKEAVHQAVVHLCLVLSVLTTAAPAPPSVPACFLPAPSSAKSVALARPDAWLIEGLPAIIRRAGTKAETRTLEFFTAEIRNPNTRRSYAHAVTLFFNWCEDRNLELADITPFAVAAYVEQLQQSYSAPTVKQHLAALRMLFDYLVVGQVMPFNPASAVRGPRHSVKKGKTPVLSVEEARTLLDSIETDRLIGLRDRALIGLMVYSFARVNAALKMRVEDYYVQGRRGWVRLHEKGGKLHTLPCHHNLEEYLEAYITAAGISGERKSPLFRTAADRSGRTLTENPLWQQDAYRMIQRRAKAAGIETRIGNHSFRATGITAYLKNGGRLEIAQQMANHESSRTTGLYDRRGDDISLDEVERIGI